MNHSTFAQESAVNAEMTVAVHRAHLELVSAVTSAAQTRLKESLLTEENDLAQELYRVVDREYQMISRFGKNDPTITLATSVPVKQGDSLLKLRLRRALPMASEFNHVDLGQVHVSYRRQVVELVLNYKRLKERNFGIDELLERMARVAATSADVEVYYQDVEKLGALTSRCVGRVRMDIQLLRHKVQTGESLL